MNKEKCYPEAIYYDMLTVVSAKTKSFDLWVFSKEGELVGLHKEGILSFLTDNGFVKRNVNNGFKLSKITNNLVEDVSIDDIKDFTKKHIWKIETSIKIYSSKSLSELKEIHVSQFREMFLNQQFIVFNNGFMSNLNSENRKVIRDTKDTAYILFKNKVLKITSSGFSELNYSELTNYLIFTSQIIDRNFEFENNWSKCEFAKFIKNITNDLQERKNAIRSGIGYLLHEYSDSAKSQAVILYDEELTDSNTPQGGTGKGIIAKAISQIKKGFVKIDGKGINLASQFLFQQIKEDTRIVFIDDITKSFDFDRLNSVLTEGINVEKKFKETYHISKEEMPKFLIASNFILSFDGSTRKRRQFILELSNFYSRKLNMGIEQPILEEHKGMFFSDDWDKTEWNRFYSFMIKCIEIYLKRGLMATPPLNLQTNYLIQKIGNELFNFFNEKEFKKNTYHEVRVMYEEYKNEYAKDEEYKQRRFSDNLSQYLKFNNYQYSFKKKGLCIE